MKIKVTKQIDLAKNDALSIIFNQKAQQHHGAYEVFYNFIKNIEPHRILEIGTARGGFINFLKKCANELNPDIDIRSYDIKDRPIYNRMRENGIDVRIKNIFDTEYLTCDDEVIDYIRSNGTTVVLCDGDEKIKEFSLLSKYIKNNDFILAHDYAESWEIFNQKIKHNIWNWCEITADDIRQAANDHGLQYYNKEMFEAVAWTCRKKC